jgi:ABC-type dipeptide/oligopeptide/nickel transport system ATPase component
MEVRDWYKEVKASGFKKGKDFKNHEIEPTSIIGLIGQSGSVKSTALIDFLYRAPKFTEIHLFSGSVSATTEPLYQLLKEKIPETKTYDTVEEIPDLEKFEKDNEKLIVFDDFLQLTPKQMKKLSQFATAGRKSGFSCIFMAQNYTSIPKVISRNFHYIWAFKIPDARSVETIHRNHVNGIQKNNSKEFIKPLHQNQETF